MKLIIIFLFIISFLACESGTSDIHKTNYQSGAFYIQKNDYTFEIYSDTGELLLEFTPDNSGPESLETLDHIFATVREFNNTAYAGGRKVKHTLNLW